MRQRRSKKTFVPKFEDDTGDWKLFLPETSSEAESAQTRSQQANGNDHNKERRRTAVHLPRLFMRATEDGLSLKWGTTNTRIRLPFLCTALLHGTRYPSHQHAHARWGASAAVTKASGPDEKHFRTTISQQAQSALLCDNWHTRLVMKVTFVASPGKQKSLVPPPTAVDVRTMRLKSSCNPLI